ncbi:MAG: electron transport complex subunit RsxC [Clostridiales bacterium]|jgi:electron transport complex protein RnfC|nr:electron transport complex subunit RsxC [Clostridiales bacterium]
MKQNVKHKKPKSFPIGVHTIDNKLSQFAPIEFMHAPDTVYIAMQQNIGKPSLPVVKPGDYVKMGQMIAKASEGLGANIFSSVSGTVQALNVKRPSTSGIANHIQIKNDGLNTQHLLQSLENPTPDEICQRIFDSGIVGLGGAGFPTHIKAKVDKQVQTLIINGAECEPYITCDHRIMLDYTSEFLKGADFLAKCVHAKQVVIAFKNRDRLLESKIKDSIKQNKLDNMDTMSFDSIYPLGAEKQLVYSVTGKKVPIRNIPLSVGVVVANVATVLAIYQSVVQGKTCYQRVLTVTGKGVKEQKNIWVANGTPFEQVLQFAGANMQDTPSQSAVGNIVKLIAGGPMMGYAVDNTQVVTTKTTNCILALTAEEVNIETPLECINCAGCSKVCPMKLMPMFIHQYGQAQDATNAAKYGAKDCIECGCCSFVCPSKIPLVQTIREAKKVVQKYEKTTKKIL